MLHACAVYVGQVFPSNHSEGQGEGPRLINIFLCADHDACVLSPQELYQKLTDYDIRFYMYELLKVRRCIESVFN